MSCNLLRIILKGSKSIQNYEVNECSLNMGKNIYSEKNTPKFMVGLWVPYMDLDVHNEQNTKEAFKNKFNQIIVDSKKHGINTLIVHVRSHGDALYESKIFPWSHILTGIQGKSPGFDPLKYMVTITHENNMEFHAWVNPLRLKSNTFPKEIYKNNPCNSFSKNYFISHKDGVIYNPAYEEIRKMIAEGVKEIVSNYDVDAIHFDDYFYPEENVNDFTYEKYLSENNSNPDKMSYTGWKKYNINILIKEVKEVIKKEKSDIKFGISPPGNLEKCELIGADIKEWIDAKYIDYICPQIYWSTEFKQMPFEKVLDSWNNILKNSDVKKYIGLALYKCGSDLDDGTWKNSNKIISDEIELVMRKNLDGIAIYSYNYLNDLNCAIEINNLGKTLKAKINHLYLR